MLKHIYEHLKTKKKYNTLELKYNVKEEELQNKIIDLNTEKNIRRVERDKFEEAIREYMDKIQKLKEEIAELKSKIKELKAKK